MKGPCHEVDAPAALRGDRLGEHPAAAGGRRAMTKSSTFILMLASAAMGFLFVMGVWRFL